MNNDRCGCGWKVGENLSGDCQACNLAVVQIAGRKRGSKPTETHHVVNPSVAVTSRVLDDDLQDFQLTSVIDARRNAQAKAKEDAASEAARAVQASTRKDAEAKEAQRKQALEDKRAADLAAKAVADDMLNQNEWVRCVTLEFGNKNPNLQHESWELFHIKRDGNCLWHAMLDILEERVREHPKSVSALRGLIADYFETHSELTVGEFVYVCENVPAIRAGKDVAGRYQHYGGLAEIVAFALKFGISVTVHCPETVVGTIAIEAGGHPEHLLQTLGWHGNARRSGIDHWQRLYPFHAPVDMEASIQVGGLCMVHVDGQDIKGRVHYRRIHGLGTDETSLQVYYYKLVANALCLGTFAAGEVRWVAEEEGPQRILVEDAGQAPEEPAIEGSAQQILVEDAENAKDDDAEDDDDEEDDDDAEEDDGSNEGDGGEDEGAQGEGGADKDTEGAQDAVPPPTTKRRRGRKAGEGNDVSWTQDTLITFLGTVVAYNPFLKDGSKIAEKWDVIAEEMARSTAHLGEHAVRTTGANLRVKFRRLQLELKNYRAGGKQHTQSGLGGVKNVDKSALADKMDECCNLQQDVVANKLHVKDVVRQQKHLREDRVEPAILALAAGNAKIRKATLKLLVQEDKKMRHEKEFHTKATPSVPWVPTPLQAKHISMWAEAQEKFPEDAKQAAEEPSKRTKLSDHISTSVKQTEEWLEKMSRPSAMEAQMMSLITTLQQEIANTPVAPVRPIQATESSALPVVQTVEQKIQTLNSLLAQNLITREMHATLVQKAIFGS